MKKILTILGGIGFSALSATPVVSCQLQHKDKLKMDKNDEYNLYEEGINYHQLSREEWELIKNARMQDRQSGYNNGDVVEVGDKYKNRQTARGERERQAINNIRNRLNCGDCDNGNYWQNRLAEARIKDKKIDSSCGTICERTGQIIKGPWEQTVLEEMANSQG